ncbi:hypothetical protein BKA64DRAFT_727881 [Cadophora sp. MPI-SDFR-AT-0126]|nr:hypothetical protein BKA64DRAFT_727881 [Leotiomycetes sp. MPI-SDFR-AT-0126]
MARIQVELSSLKFNKIGSIYQNGDEFAVGPELQTGLGPWDNEMDYHRAISQQLFAVANEEADPDVKKAEAFMEVPRLFERLMKILVAKKPTEKGFRLANREFGATQLAAAPLPVVAQFPQRTGLCRRIPGHVETRPAALERMARVEPQLKEYRDMVALAEIKRNGGNKEEPGIAESLISDPSLLEYRQQKMTAPLSLNTPDSDSAPRDHLRLCPDGAIITPKRLTLACNSDQVRHTPATKKRKADYSESPSGVRLIARKKGLQAKRAKILLNGAAQIQLARECSSHTSSIPSTCHINRYSLIARRLGTLEVLPNEIILQILGMLEHNALEPHYQRVQDFGLVCLALTSIDFYKICKIVHPSPLPTTRGDAFRDENSKFWAWSLERHIGDFLGPAYEVREPDSRYGFYTRYRFPFLHKDDGSYGQAKALNTDDIFS